MPSSKPPVYEVRSVGDDPDSVNELLRRIDADGPGERRSLRFVSAHDGRLLAFVHFDATRTLHRIERADPDPGLLVFDGRRDVVHTRGLPEAVTRICHAEPPTELRAAPRLRLWSAHTRRLFRVLLRRGDVVLAQPLSGTDPRRIHAIDLDACLSRGMLEQRRSGYAVVQLGGRKAERIRPTSTLSAAVRKLLVAVNTLRKAGSAHETIDRDAFPIILERAWRRAGLAPRPDLDGPAADLDTFAEAVQGLANRL